jgi:hypothetical protein
MAPNLAAGTVDGQRSALARADVTCQRSASVTVKAWSTTL